MIEPDIDAYGGLAHGSALADYLELLALSGATCARAQLEDSMNDKYLSDWKRKRRNNVVDTDDWDESSETYDDSDDHEIAGHIEEAYQCLDERVDVLGDRYPFDLDANGILTRKPGVDVTKSSYVALLCITVAHAYRIRPAGNVREAFEETVAQALEARGLIVARMGELSRAAGYKFVPALLNAGDILQIPINPAGAPFKRHANDGGADVLAHSSWRDGRHGRWTLAGQITCASSDQWQAKMGEAQPGLWRGFFSEQVEPQCFLAVPHHAPKGTYNLIVFEHGKLLVDRLKLVLSLDEASDQETKIISAVLAEDVDHVAAA